VIEILPNWPPLLVHFTVGLLSTSVLFYLAGAFLSKKNSWKQQWLNMANWSLWSGCLFAIGTAIAGWLAYNIVAHDTASHAAMTLHRNWALPTAATFLLLGLWAIIPAKKDRYPGFMFLTFSTIAAGLLMVTGWLGGEAVYRYGLGVKSLPSVEEGADGHNHSHGTMQNEEGGNAQQHSTAEIDHPLLKDGHPHDHENKEIPPNTDQAKSVTEHTHNTTSEDISETSVQPSVKESHHHDSISIEPITTPLDKGKTSEEMTLPPPELKFIKHAEEQEVVVHDHNHEH
jgi:uncharacterized membrane protein